MWHGKRDTNDVHITTGNHSVAGMLVSPMLFLIPTDAAAEISIPLFQWRMPWVIETKIYNVSVVCIWANDGGVKIYVGYVPIVPDDETITRFMRKHKQ